MSLTPEDPEVVGAQIDTNTEAELKPDPMPSSKAILGSEGIAVRIFDENEDNTYDFEAP